MKSFVVLGLAAAALAQSPDGCSSSSSGTFQITTVNVTTAAKRDVEKRQLSGTLALTLSDGILKDQAGRQGYIASNYQYDSLIILLRKVDSNLRQVPIRCACSRRRSRDFWFLPLREPVPRSRQHHCLLPVLVG